MPLIKTQDIGSETIVTMHILYMPHILHIPVVPLRSSGPVIFLSKSRYLPNRVAIITDSLSIPSQLGSVLDFSDLELGRVLLQDGLVVVLCLFDISTCFIVDLQ